MVVINHTDGAVGGMTRLFTREIWACGVDIFFVISGFIIYYVSWSKRGHVSQFVVDRIIRVAPLYWLFTALTAVSLLVAPGAFRHASLSEAHVILSFLFIPHINPSSDTISPLLAIGWTLIYEMHFYVLFAVCMGAAFRFRALIASGVFLGAAGVGLMSGNGGDAVIGFYTNSMLLEFIFGLGLCALLRAGRLTLPPAVAVLMAIAGFAGLAAAGEMPSELLAHWRGVVWGVPAAAVVCAALALDRAGFGRSGLLSRLGDASYSIYLSHLFVMGSMRAVWTKVGIPVTASWSDPVFIAVVMVLSTALGFAVYHLIEAPLISMFRRKTFPLAIRSAQLAG